MQVKNFLWQGGGMGEDGREDSGGGGGVGRGIELRCTRVGLMGFPWEGYGIYRGKISSFK
jgi:hypothetical protein